MTWHTQKNSKHSTSSPEVLDKAVECGLGIKMKSCSKCKSMKEESEFGDDPRNKSGLKSSCKECGRESARASYKTHREKRVKQSRKYLSKNRDRYNANRRLKRSESRITEASRKYGILKSEVEALFKKTKCQICYSDISFNNKNQFQWPNIDHCHSTGKVRGVLCGYCNNMLGKAKDDIETLESAISYLIINR